MISSFCGANVHDLEMCMIVKKLEYSTHVSWNWNWSQH